ncbi:MAG: selenide, water dikinase SelD [Bacillota bacterium]|nr:selenide, water dikinase SelD [Bacillota bacterium]
MSPADLTQVLGQLPVFDDPNLLVGASTADDAGVYKVNDELALVQTVDYFTPVVDDPFIFGQITATNALSDIYAMGAKPMTVLNIIAFPTNELPLTDLALILQGGADKVKEAGACIVGGHSISDKEPKYGMAVTALIHPDKVVTNAGAKEGDWLVLTKPLGLGIITTAIKRGKASEKVAKEAIQVMTTLNKDGAEVMTRIGVNSCTDITGFGFLGHLWEMTKASKVGAKIYATNVPVLEEANNLVAQGICPGGTKKNLTFLQDAVNFDHSITDEMKLILADAQTSGGLLIAVPPEKGRKLVSELILAGVPAHVVGEITNDNSGTGKIMVLE